MALPRVSILVPWSGNCEYRKASWQHVRRWYEAHHPDFQVVVGAARTTPWCKARAVADAIARSNGELLVVADADCIPVGLSDAVHAVAEGAPWAMPHYLVKRLNRQATEYVLQGADPECFPVTRTWYDRLPYAGIPGGGVTVLPRRTYEHIPLDVSFTGWGQEDQAWSLALNALAGQVWRPSRIPLWHLWHPPQPRITRATGSAQSRRRLREYKYATTHDQLMEILEDSRRFLRGAA